MLALLALALLALVGGLAAETRAEQARSYAEVEDRFSDRIQLAADYVHAHLDEIRRQQSAHSLSHLDGAAAEPSGLDADVAALARGPLTRFLEASSSLPGRKLYLVDGDGQVITSTEGDGAADFARQAPALEAAPVGASTTTHVGAEHLVVGVPVEDTQWRLVAAVPSAELHEPVSGATRMLWSLVAATAAMALLVFVLLSWVSRQRDHLRQISRTDKLTGLANRGRAEEVMARASAVSERTGQPWAVAMVDVDRFKSVNDRLGHAGGDRVLRRIAAVLEAEARRSDLCARWGGEEFVVVLEGTDLAAAAVACKRFADAVRRSTTPDGAVTISVGVAAATGGDVEELVGSADRALYEAKRLGRDRVVAAPGSDDVVRQELARC